MNFLVLILIDFLSPFIALGVIVKFLLSPRRGLIRNLPDELNERFGGLCAQKLDKLAGRPALWVHAASAGEVAAVEEFLRRLRERPDAPAVVLTTMTRSGREAASRLAQADVAALAPIDCWPAVRRFLRRVRPYALILVETELWPHMVELSARAGVRIGLVNGRVSERGFGRYRLVSPFLRRFWGRLERAAAQSEADARRFAALGVPAERIFITGNMKYDRLKAGADDRGRAEIARLGWQGVPLLVAASTHPGEEEILLEGFLEVRRRHPDLRLILAPRHVERCDAAAETLRLFGLSFVRLGQESKNCDALLVDAMGWLPSFYACAGAVFVGGSLVPVGGHNLLEPAASGVPVLFGPYTSHARQAAEALKDCGGGFEVTGSATLATTLERLLDQPALAKECGRKAQALVHSLQGATARTLEHLAPLIAVKPGSGLR